MGITSLCLMLSTLVIHPNRSQFFWYDTITLTCGEAGSSDGWRLKRNASSQASQLCNSDWGVSNESSCVIEDAYPSDSGVYWCESELGECSNSVNVTVTDGAVILETPALPVTEGDKVTLLCSIKDSNNRSAAANFSANFFKDDIFIGARPAGNMTLLNVSTSDEGFYRCELPTEGKSPQSWLAVKAVRAEPPPLMPVPRLVCAILLTILHFIMFIICVNIHRKVAKVLAESKQRASSGR